MTKRLISLVYEKNHYLEKFYALNEAELKNFMSGQFDNLENFYQTRERILEVIRYVDSEIEKAHDQTVRTGVQIETNSRQELKKAMRIKDEYVERIIQQDLEMLACIDRAKTDIIREMRDLKIGKKAMSGYRLPDFTTRLDEEA